MCKSLMFSSCMLLSACAPAPNTDWFPLQAGFTQTYGVTWLREDERQQAVWTQRVGASREWRDDTVWPRRHSEGVTFWLQADARGIRRVATQADIDRGLHAETEERWVLKAPYVEGTAWTQLTVPYLLEQEWATPKQLKHSKRMYMSWRIAAVDDTVTVPAGKFSPCLRVEGKANLTLYVNPELRFQDVPVLSTEWYCQGHGLVKWTRREVVPKGFFQGGEVVAELLGEAR